MLEPFTVLPGITSSRDRWLSDSELSYNTTPFSEMEGQCHECVMCNTGIGKIH